jgi:glutaredoxin
MKTELYGSASCQVTAEVREDLEWRGVDFSEYDVERDAEALARMLALTRGERTVPVLVEDGKLKSIGLNGRGCVVLGA